MGMKIYANHTSKKKLIPQIYKELSKKKRPRLINGQKNLTRPFLK
jgi:hypothetical protein